MTSVAFIDLKEEINADDRGFSFFVFPGRVRKAQDVLRSFHLVSIEPGQVRGNHLHPGHEEWLYPFHGIGVLQWEAPPGQVQERVVSGNRALVRIPPGVAHALKNPGLEILYLLAWREAVEPAGQEPETVARLVSSD
ncbi:MAG: cupin domain-containing protein [Thermodesulfobacteriota bacterium]